MSQLYWDNFSSWHSCWHDTWQNLYRKELLRHLVLLHLLQFVKRCFIIATVQSFKLPHEILCEIANYLLIEPPPLYPTVLRRWSKEVCPICSHCLVLQLPCTICGYYAESIEKNMLMNIEISDNNRQNTHNEYRF